MSLVEIRVIDVEGESVCSGERSVIEGEERDGVGGDIETLILKRRVCHSSQFYSYFSVKSLLYKYN